MNFLYNSTKSSNDGKPDSSQGIGGFSLSALPSHLPNSNIEEEQKEHEAKEEEKNPNMIEEVEEEEVKGIKNNCMFIPGTKISLQTDEDIAKWIEERKKRWPTKKNIELKEKEKEERQKNQKNSEQNQNQNQIQASGNLKRKNDGSDSSEVKRPKNVCRFYQQHKKCKFGNRCKNLHVALNGTMKSKASSNVRTINNIKVTIPQRYKSEQNDASLFKKLVQKDQFENENELVLEFVQYLNDNNFIDHNISI